MSEPEPVGDVLVYTWAMMEPEFNPFDRSTRNVNVSSIVRMAILGALRKKKSGMTRDEIVSAVGCRRASVLAALKEMWGTGDVKARPRMGRGGGVIWFVE